METIDKPTLINIVATGTEEDVNSIEPFLSNTDKNFWDKALIFAIESNNPAGVLRCIKMFYQKNERQIDACDAKGYSALDLAVKFDLDQDVIKALMDHGSYGDNYALTYIGNLDDGSEFAKVVNETFMRAALNGNVLNIKLILSELKLKELITSEGFRGALVNACIKNCSDIVEVLLTHTEYLQEKLSLTTALNCAIENKHIGVLASLLNLMRNFLVPSIDLKGAKERIKAMLRNAESDEEKALLQTMLTML
jgi:hypothetical protein